MIYFNTPTQQELVLKLINQLAPRGYFVVGHSESLPGIKHPSPPSSPAFTARTLSHALPFATPTPGTPLLIANGVALAASETGGHESPTVRLDLGHGTLTLDIPSKSPYPI